MIFYSFANFTVNPVTWKQFLAGFFSPGTTIRKGPVPAGNGFPSTWSANITTWSVKLESSSASENTTW
jgi:hypothetical protein